MSEGLILRGRYRLVERLGGGAMGSVWRADDLSLNAPVAVKLIDPSIAESPEAISRFQREAQAAAAIRSTYVVQILEHGVDGNVPFIAMELLEGESLAARLEREGCLTPAQTVHILTQVGQALTRAHASKIVHRDLKPDNIFLVPEGQDVITKVLDFGIARRLGELSQSGGLQTQTGTTLGTPNYMSPEQAGAKPVDDRSDIWSFGVIAFECLTGKLPFASDTWGGLFHAICIDPLPIPSEVGPVPAGFDAWFARAVARDPSQRFASAAEAAIALRRACEQDSTKAAFGARVSESGHHPRDASPLDRTTSPASLTVPDKEQHRSRRWVALAVAGLLLVAAAVATWAARNSHAVVSTMPDSTAASTVLGTSGAVQAQSFPPVVPAPLDTPHASDSDTAGVSSTQATSTGDAAKSTGPASPQKTENSRPAAAAVRANKGAPAATAKRKYHERVGF